MKKSEQTDYREFIVLRAGNSPNEIVKIDLENFNEGVYKALNIDIYEHVRLGNVLGIDLHMLVDEEGALNDSKLNRQATYLYGHHIFGDALLCTVDDNYNFGPVEGSEFFKLYSLFFRNKVSKS